MSRSNFIKGALCILLHAYIVWNVYELSKLTPRPVVIVRYCEQPTEPPKAFDPNPEVST